uniref:FAD/NAD(P)-binding domain-containing protein n=1 Tax=Anopheles maculatus TaxID=74869 RepID=A0A182SNG5_9DIPT
TPNRTNDRRSCFHLLQIDHLVLGRGPPGGSWHRMDPNLRTLSLAAWMSLPGLPFAEWESRHPPVEAADESVAQPLCARCNELAKRSKRNGQKVPLIKCSKCYRNGTHTDGNNNTSVAEGNAIPGEQHGDGGNVVAVLDERSGKVNVKLLCPPRRNLSLKRQVSKEVETRALISSVAQYYESYVTEMGLERYFMNETIVTTVVPLDGKCDAGLPERFRQGRWIVAGFNRTTNKRFTVVCNNLVLANGASDLANRLGVKGEGLEKPWVKYELPHLERALEKYDDHARTQLKPVLIVGAGLSAADAVTICRSSGIPVVHVYRNRTAGLDKMLPGNVYPEYHEVHKMMKDSNRKHELYTPLPEHTIVDLAIGGDSRRVTVQHLKTGERRELDVSYCAILIGSRPDLRFISSIMGTKGTNQPPDAPNPPVLISCPDSETEDEMALNHCFGRQPVQPLTMWMFTEQLLSSCLGRKLYWLKNMCAKCKHINLTDKPRHKQQQLHQQQYNVLGGHCQHQQDEKLALNLSAA